MPKVPFFKAALLSTAGKVPKLQHLNFSFGGRRRPKSFTREFRGSIVIESTVADRVAFWQRALERLKALGNRTGSEIDKIEMAMHERVPIPSLEEQRELKSENARACGRRLRLQLLQNILRAWAEMCCSSLTR